MKSFFKEAVNSIKTSGTIIPSSKYLINDCLNDINFSNNNIILEFGAGNGCITDELLKRNTPESHLISFEVNSKFFKYCKDQFMYYENFTMVNHSAIYFDEVLGQQAIEKVDYIISSLPLALLDENDVLMLLEKILKFLKQDGCFIQYQYSLDKYKLLKQNFSKVKVDFTLINIPPSFVYKCYL